MNDEFLYSIWNFFAANLSPQTRKNYYNVVKGYVKLTGHSPEELTFSDSDMYFKDLVAKMNNNKLSRNTAIMRLSVMKSLCDYIEHKRYNEGKEYHNYFNEYIIPDKDKSIKEEDIASDEEIDYILRIAKKNKDIAFYTLTSLIVKCGLSTSEICRLTYDSIIYDKKNNICLEIKENKRTSRIIKLPADVNKIFKAYLKSLAIADIENNIIRSNDNKPLFLNKRNTALKVRDAERLLKSYVEQGIQDKAIKKGFTLQQLRHSAIKYMLMGDAREDEVADYLGITTKWMSRYRRVVEDGYKLTSADLSVISIKP